MDMDTLTPSRFEVIADDVVVERDVMVTMRDGMRLATDVYRPAKDGKAIEGRLPAIMERTPYGKAERSRSEIEVGMAEPMKRHEVGQLFRPGGICRDLPGLPRPLQFRGRIQQIYFGSRRRLRYRPLAGGTGPGRTASSGRWAYPMRAHTQAALACLNPPGLACMVMDSGGFSNAYQCGIRQGGAFELKQATWAYNQAIGEGNEVARAAIEAEDLHAWFNVMPWSEGNSPVRWMPEYESYLLDQWRSGTFDESWRRVGLYMEGFYETFPEVPVVLMSSWYDAYVKSTLDNYRGLSGKGSRPLQLIMGPWLHGNRNATLAGDTSFGPAAPLGGNVMESWLSFRRNWFDHWLKGKDNTVAQEPVVRAFVMGGGSGTRDADGRLDHGGHWIEAADWPLPGTEFRNYYVHENGSLSTDRPKAEASPFTYDFDPKNPVPTIGGSLTSGQPIFEGGGFDQREGDKFYGSKHPGLPLSARADVLSFETEPLAEDVAVVGADHGGALCLVGCAGHGLHRETRRRLSAEQGLPDRLRAQHHRRDHPLPLSQLLRKAGADRQGRGVQGDDRAVRDRQPVRQGPPHPG
jgi:predicted acyl esterase